MSSAGPSACPRGTECHPSSPRAVESGSSSVNALRPDCRGSRGAGPGRGSRPPIQAAELGLHAVQGAIGIDRADDHQDRAVGPIVGLVKGL